MKKRVVVTILVSIVFLVSCSARVGLISGNYGKIRANEDVTDSFQNYRIKNDHTYYTSGPDSYPNAMIGVDDRYVLVSNLWKQRDLTPKTMKALVGNMESKAREYGSMLHGFDILDNRGNDIGDRYSILSLTTTVRILDGNKITITTPPIDTYEGFKMKLMRPGETD
jgi:hypothetical protein